MQYCNTYVKWTQQESPQTLHFVLGHATIRRKFSRLYDFLNKNEHVKAQWLLVNLSFLKPCWELSPLESTVQATPHLWIPTYYMSVFSVMINCNVNLGGLQWLVTLFNISLDVAVTVFINRINIYENLT
jgi:hypothetical protein